MSEPSDIGAPPELAWLPVDKLDVDERYQRSLETKASQRLIEKIAQEFSWMKFQALLCARKPDGPERYLLIDGQHRKAAATKRGDIPQLPALVFASASLAEQATAFVGANKDRVPVSAQALFHARLLAGDPDAQTIARICASAGVEILRYPLPVSKTGAGKTTAVSALLRLLREHPEARIAEALAALADALRHDIGGIRSAFIMAAVRFLQEGGGAEELSAGLRRLGTKRLEAAGVGLGGHSMVSPMAALLWHTIGRNPAGPGRKAAETFDQSRANAGDSAAAATQAPAGIDPASRLAGGRTPALLPQGRTQGEAQTSASGVTGGESAAPSPARSKENVSGHRFADDPRAKRDPGSSGRQPRSEPFGRSFTGSSLA